MFRGSNIRIINITVDVMHILFLVLSYFLGAIPFGLLIGKIVGADVRTQGSKNIGATNVSRVLGKKLGKMTLVCDLLKGFLPLLLASYFLPESDQKMIWVAFCGVAAVLGHMYPVYLGFKGGKGVATGLGVFLFLSPLAIGIALVIFIGSVALSGFVSVGSLAASAIIPVLLLLFGESWEVVLASAIIAMFIWVKHHENIGRLIRGEEKSWKKKEESK